MNSGFKAAVFMPQSNCSQLRAALFHSTPVLERKRRNFWGHYTNAHRSSKWQTKQRLLNNISAFTDSFFQNWSNFEDDDPSPGRATSWFRKQDTGGSRRNWNQGTRRSGRKSYEFCEDDFDVENTFRSMSGGNQYIYWSFINEENPQWRSSSSDSNYYGRNRKFRVEYDYDSSPESDNVGSDLASERLALGMSVYGPLKLEDVKNAYRACALKWHPDRHQGSSKAVAEEKFKHCSAAYQSLCNKLGAD